MAVPLPDRATLDAARKRAEEDRAFWNAHRDELTQQYPDELVAFRNGKVIDHDRDLMALASRLEAHGIQTSEVAIELAATKPEIYLL